MRATPLVAGVLGLMVVSSGALAADGTAVQGGETWRSTKLIGVPIFGPDKVSIGKIDDLLLGHDGKIASIVVGVGGFLGIGEKDVAVPFDAVTFSATPIPPPANPMAMAAPTDTTAVPMGTGNIPPPMATVPAAGTAGIGGALSVPPPPATSSAYPDHGTITMTKDELTAMPTFQFAK